MIKLVKKRWYVLIVLFIAAAFFLYKKIIIKSQIKAEDTYVVKRQNLKETLSLSGEIDAEEKVSLKFQTSGMLNWVGVKEGDWVKRYQTIASLDQRELEKSLKKSLNTYMKTRWDYDQTNEDYKDQAVTDAIQRIKDKAGFDLDNAVIDVELKDIALKYASLYSPIEGIVTHIEVPYAGVNITPATAQFDIVNPKTIYFSAKVDQTEVVKLKENLTGVINLDPYPDLEIKGSIKTISFVPKEGETGTVYEVKIAINDNNDDYKYRLGMTGDVSFELQDKKDVIAIPASFVKTENGKNYVWKLEAGKRTKTYIKIGEEIDGEVEVLSGLKEEDVIYD